MSAISTITLMTANVLAGKVIVNYFIYSWNVFAAGVCFFLIVAYLISEEKIISDNNKKYS